MNKEYPYKVNIDQGREKFTIIYLNKNTTLYVGFIYFADSDTHFCSNHFNSLCSVYLFSKKNNEEKKDILNYDFKCNNMREATKTAKKWIKENTHEKIKQITGISFYKIKLKK